LRIFYICRRVPFPPDRGDKIAAFNEIRHLAAQHEMHVFCLGDGVQDLANISGLQAYAMSVTAAPVDEFTIKLRALAALFTGQPLSVAALNEMKLHDAIQKKFAELRPDLIIVYSCNMAQFAVHFPEVPRVMHFGDLDSLKWRQYAERSSIPLNWIYAVEAQRLLGYERHVAKISSHALVHTEIEKDDFGRLIPGIPVTVVGNGVDLDYFRSAGGKRNRDRWYLPESWIAARTSMPSSGSATRSCRLFRRKSRRRISRSAAVDLRRRCADWPNAAV